MFGISRRKLRRLIDTDKVKEAIVRAEHMTSGEVRVSVSSFFWGNAHKVAEKAFVRMGMANTEHRNGVLIFVVPSRKRFVILGDKGIHEKVGQSFWDDVRDAMSDRFREGDFTGGLVHGITEVGLKLKDHFPYEGEKDVNELPDDVDFGGDD